MPPQTQADTQALIRVQAQALPRGLPWRGIAIAVATNAFVLIAFHDQIGRVLARGFHPHWPNLALVAREGLAVQLHLGAVLIALAVSVFMLSGAKGTRVHRIVGWGWAAAMMTAVIASFFIRSLNPGHLSWIHILAGWTAFATPLGVWAARTHRVKTHRQTMIGLVLGGLLLAGALAFIPGRLMWRVFFG